MHHLGSLFRHWYQWAIHDNPGAVENLALITSHGFGIGDAIHARAAGLLWLKRPELHAWTTSMTWGGKRDMKDYDFVNLIRGSTANRFSAIRSSDQEQYATVGDHRLKDSQLAYLAPAGSITTFFARQED